MAALDIFAPDLCEPSMFCVNVEGNYSCECLAGTLLVEGVCEAGKCDVMNNGWLRHVLQKPLNELDGSRLDI